MTEQRSAAEELLFRRKVRKEFATFCDHALPTCPGVVWPDPANPPKPAAHQRLLIDVMQQVADAKEDRIIFNLPPGSAKTTYTSKLLPAFFMARGDQSIILASHTGALAEKNSADCQRIIKSNTTTLGYGLETEAVGRWRTTNGCELLAAGVGASIAGFRASLAIIDDPVGSREQADSEAYRERCANWFYGDLLHRLRPGGRIIVLMTRWHTDDLAGRLIEAEADKWRAIRVPAIADSVDDPLGRAVGELLWADDAYGYGAMLQSRRDSLEKAGKLREWSAQFQGSPVPATGLLFQADKITVVAAATAGGTSVRAWDLAATRDGDWTVGVKMTRYPDGRYVIADVVRLRGSPHQVEDAIERTAIRDGHGVTTSLPQDPGQAGKSQIAHLTSLLAGFRVVSSPESGSKVVRSGPLASQVEAGNVSIVSGEWSKAVIGEFRDFPAGKFDDAVDACSRAFMELTGKRPMKISAAALDRARGRR